MDQAAIRKHISDTYPGVDVVIASPGDGSPEVAWGDSFFIYDPGRKLDANRKFPFATIVTKDYENFDIASDLNRPEVFRLNIGVSKQTYQALNSGADQRVIPPIQVAATSGTPGR